jgi:ferredoxin
MLSLRSLSRIVACSSHQVRSCPINATTLRGFASKKITFNFLEESSGDLIEVQGEEGQTVLEVALKHDINIEGACGGELACSTCHVIVPQALFKQLPTKKIEEEDMLDLAWGITDT